MSKFDNFDIDQTSSKFAQKWRDFYFCDFYCKKISIQGSLDNTENAKRQFLFAHAIM